jgi:hypothetical protein
MSDVDLEYWDKHYTDKINEIARLSRLAESDTVQDMDSDPVEPDMEIGFESARLVDGVYIGEFGG